LCSVSRRPIWAGTRSDNLLVGPGTPGVETPTNIKVVLSPFGLTILLLLFSFHTSSFVACYHLAGTWFLKSDDVKALQRTISFETGEVLSYYMRLCSFQFALLSYHYLLMEACKVSFLLLF
jgi:hypothetical protein